MKLTIKFFRPLNKIFWLPLLILAQVSFGQNYTSTNSGPWTTAANWNNTSGWGGATPPLTYTSGTINVNHNMTLASAASFGGTGFNVASGASITTSANFTFSNGTANVNGNISVSGNFTVSNGTTNIYGTVSTTGNFAVSGGATVNVYGTLIIAGNASLNANLRVHPGGKVIVEGSVTVVSSTYLTIGTAVAPPPYADMIIHQNLVQQSSGDVTINRNGRLAVFGNVTDSGGGGTFIQVNNGGQAYVHGNITYSGGGSSIQNNNTTNPYGLYVNGTATSSGGGGSVTANMGDQQTMKNTNPDFFTWVASQPNSPMPVTLLYFQIEKIDKGSVQLAWATTMEQDFNYFEIERSTNGMDFISIGKMAGAGYNTETIQPYGFTDSNPVMGSNYYRLKAVDLDGSFEYFNIVFAQIKTDKQLSIYPNPSDGDRVVIQLNFEPLQIAKIQVSDLTGAVVAEAMVTGMEVEFEFSNQLKPGIYMVSYYSLGFKHTERMLVRN
ncbi:MAG: T9SS type A sorting domain-containing protein [Cyclobacteriaceae bacterium]|nr:T9SS type A sorting domain-containing protein [Cyclobacteriaceae bacterium]UYN86449.1 MAG: T9SS type A sorting domain-containing protein [Cyclobacteriaceae bacterium]